MTKWLTNVNIAGVIFLTIVSSGSLLSIAYFLGPYLMLSERQGMCNVTGYLVETLGTDVDDEFVYEVTTSYKCFETGDLGDSKQSLHGEDALEEFKTTTHVGNVVPCVYNISGIVSAPEVFQGYDALHIILAVVMFVTFGSLAVALPFSAREFIKNIKRRDDENSVPESRRHGSCFCGNEVMHTQEGLVVCTMCHKLYHADCVNTRRRERGTYDIKCQGCSILLVIAPYDNSPPPVLVSVPMVNSSSGYNVSRSVELYSINKQQQQ